MHDKKDFIDKMASLQQNLLYAKQVSSFFINISDFITTYMTQIDL